MRSFFKQLPQKKIILSEAQSPLWLSYGTNHQLTFHGKPFTQTALFNEISLNGTLRIRGASIKESPLHNTGHKGTLSRSEIASKEALIEHTRYARGISTTHAKPIAARFAEDCGKAGVIHTFDHSLVPAEDKKFIPDVLEDHVIAEQETVFCKSVPEEVYAGYWNNLSFQRSFFANPHYIDPVILSKNPELQNLFFDTIYKPFSTEIAPAIREKTITAFKETHYEHGRKEFHNQYRFFAQRYLKNQHALEKDKKFLFLAVSLAAVSL
ncbi:MAG: hypothetical protein Q8L78_00775 [Coxiellaceae bacterium]|nr:hypothetical protein [Coxiellaceae bacterium]